MTHGDVDYKLYDVAKKTITDGDEIIEINCSCCQGMSMPNRKKNQPGYCPMCAGETYVKIKRWEHASYEFRIDYWQARALVAEKDLIDLVKSNGDK